MQAKNRPVACLHGRRRALKEQQLDPVVALGLLMKVLSDDHIDHFPEAEEQSEDEQDAKDEAGDHSAPTPITLFEILYDLVQKQSSRSGEQWKRAYDAAGRDENAMGAAPRIAGDMLVALGQLREVLALALDTADKIGSLQQPRDAA